MKKWLADRFAVGPIWRNVLDRRVPETPWYYGDGSTLTLLLIALVVTGALMGMTYSPHIDSAHASVVYLTEQQTMGWFIRGLHYWCAGLMVVMLVFHLFRQIMIGGYKAPREGTWLVGVLLFFAVIFMSFSGYLLRWDERAVAAVKVSMHMFYNIPVIGEWLVVLIQGGREIGPLTLTRIYGLHVVIMPLFIFALTGYHVYLVIHHGVTSVSEQEQDVETATKQRKLYKRDAKSEERGEHFLTETSRDSGIMASAVFILAMVLTITQGPAEIVPEASLYSRAFPMEEWWFAWYSALIAMLPRAIAPAFVVVFPLMLFFGMLLLPFFDRGPKRGIGRRPWATGFIIVSVIAILVLSSMRRESAWTAWPMEEAPPVPPELTLSAEAEHGRQLFPVYGCNSCHAVGGHGRQVAIDLAQITRRMSHAELVAYIRQPPPGIAMPAYDDIPEEDLARLADFVLAAQTFPREN